MLFGEYELLAKAIQRDRLIRAEQSWQLQMLKCGGQGLSRLLLSNLVGPIKSRDEPNVLGFICICQYLRQK